MTVTWDAEISAASPESSEEATGRGIHTANQNPAELPHGASVKRRSLEEKIPTVPGGRFSAIPTSSDSQRQVSRL